MKVNFYTYNLVLLSLLVFGSCKSQPSTTTSKNAPIKQAVADSVAYEILKDSVYCKAINDYYYFELLSVKYPNKKVQGSINKFIIDLDKYTRDYKLEDEINATYTDKLREIIEDKCVKESEASGWDFIDSEYEVTINEKQLFGFKYSWIVPGYAHYNFEEYNFNLKSGTEITNQEVFNDNHQKLLNDLNQNLLNEINWHVNSILEEDDYSTEDKESFEDYVKEKKYVYEEIPQWYLLKENGTLGIQFQLRYRMMAGYNHGAYIPVFYSLKQLEPYLNQQFKDQINHIKKE